MQREKVRVYALARELNVESKDLLDVCRQAGFDVKNQLSSLDPEQRDLVEQMLKRGGTAVAVAAPPRPAAALPTIGTPIRNLSKLPRREEPPPAKAPAALVPPQPQAPPALPKVGPARQEPGVPPKPVQAPPPRPAETPLAPQHSEMPPGAAARVPETVPPVSPQESEGSVSVTSPRLPTIDGGGKVRDLGGPGRTDRPGGRKTPREFRHTFSRKPGLASPPPLKKEPPREPKKQVDTAQKPLMKFTPEMLNKQGSFNPQELLKPAPGDQAVMPPEFEEEEGGDAKKGKKSTGGKPAVPGRDKRQAARQERTKQRKGRVGEVQVVGSRVLVPDDDDRPHRKLADRLRKAQKPRPITQPRKGKVPLEFPITVRSLSEAVGINKGDLIFRLIAHGLDSKVMTINSSLDPQIAELIAVEVGVELDIRRAPDAEDQMVARLQGPDNPEDLQPRAPVVTVMGHVDHGKTSLLDRIRRSNVVATEAGGITQVIRAWRVEHDGRFITFLDTPGHEAFTKMRARGAQVTDIAIIVVAADDGVMPQTEEAINHAKAAEVPIVVAINKVDLPNANLNKTRQQLYGLGLLPDNMGGDIPFVETSAATGKGIDELLENILIVAETLLELQANPNKPGSGTCLEAMLTEGEGVRATLLVQNGTLRRGDALLCGATYGRVRQMYNDLGQPLLEAGPSIPVQITGLDLVPNADDPFQAVPEMTLARDVADKRKARLQADSIKQRPPVTLETLSQAKISELKVILKADFRGSIEAIRKEMEKLQHEEVRIRILHAAIGGITDSDVQLALTSPQDTLILGFNVVPDDRARALAEERAVQIRQYNIIYNLTDDIRAALEGRLKPRIEEVQLGRAVVRDTFKISRVGTIAGCYVTQGVIERSAKIRLIREGVVVYPPPERTVGLESLKRFKEDVREVREGFECGLKIAGYDDIKVGDVIEAYRIEQVQRTL